MKPRTVMVTLELTTDAPLKKLRDRKSWKSVLRVDQVSHVLHIVEGFESILNLEQVTAQVAQAPKPK